MSGSTVAVKNWIGVLTTAYTNERYGSWENMHYVYFWGTYALVARVMQVIFPRLVFVDAAWTSTYNANDLNWLAETDMLVASTDPVAASYYAAKYILTPIARYPYYTSPDYGRYGTTLTRWTTYLADSAGFACTNDTSEMSVYDRRVLNPPGDANGDGEVNVGDVVFIINFLYRGGDPPVPMERADANCDGIVDVGDVVYLVNYLYRGGPEPCEASARRLRG
jgi:hypothetical protein